MEKAKKLPVGSARIASNPSIVFSRLPEASMNLLMVKCTNNAKTEEVVKSLVQEKHGVLDLISNQTSNTAK